VYFVEWRGELVIQRMPKTGGTPEDVVVGGGDLALDDEHLYYTMPTVARAAKAAGVPERLSPREGHRVVVDATSAYVTSCPTPACAVVELLAIPKAGGAPRRLYAAASHEGHGMALAEGELLLADHGSGAVHAVAVRDGSARTLVADLPGPIAVAADDEDAFWVDLDSGDVGRVALAHDAGE
jgi:hypothetical protein